MLGLPPSVLLLWPGWRLRLFAHFLGREDGFSLVFGWSGVSIFKEVFALPSCPVPFGYRAFPWAFFFCPCLLVVRVAPSPGCMEGREKA